MNGKIVKKFYENHITNFSSKFYPNHNSKKIIISDRDIGVYLSGGIDSFIATKLISKNIKRIKSFGISFADTRFDEKEKQFETSKLLRTNHYNVKFNDEDFFENLLRASFYAEIPNTRFAHIPMYLLSKKQNLNKRQLS